MSLDIKGVLAVLVMVGNFLLIGVPYIAEGRLPDALVIGFVSGSTSLILGFYFGHINGAQTALTNSALGLAQAALTQSQQRRLSDPPVVAAPVTVIPPPSA